MGHVHPPEASKADALLCLITLVALVIPWLWPIAIGPWPATLPWIASLVCGALTLLLGVWSRMDWPKAVALAWVLAAAISSVIGLLQYFGHSAAWVPLVNTTPIGEAFANLRQRNQFATLTNIGLIAVLSWLSTGRAGNSNGDGARDSPAHRPQVVAAFGIVALLPVAGAASSSRTGLLQLGLVLAMFWVWGCLRQKNLRTAFVVAGVAYAAASWMLPRLAGLDPSATGILARLQDGAPACASRLTLWANVLHLIAQKPWLGWGWGELDYAHFMTLYAGPRFCDILDNAHNLPLHLAVELGVPVAVAACGLGMWLLWRSRPWQETHPTRQMAWAVLAVILLHSMLEYPLWYGPFQIATALSIWILWVTPRQPVPEPSADTARSPAGALSGQNTYAAKVMLTSVAVVLLLGAAYAAWDYRRVSQIYLATSERAPAYRDNTSEKVRDSRLFARQVRFAELTTADLQPANAAYLNAMAHDLLHFSPEARVVEKLIESAELLGRDDEALAFLARYQAAFPAAHAAWVKSRRLP